MLFNATQRFGDIEDAFDDWTDEDRAELAELGHELSEIAARAKSSQAPRNTASDSSKHVPTEFAVKPSDDD